MSQKLIAKVKDLEAKYRLISENLIDAVWVIDAQSLKFEYITPSIEKISGYSADEFVTLTVKDRLTQQSFQKMITMLKDEKQKYKQGAENIGQLEVELIHKKGSIYWAEIKAKFFKEDGQPLKIIGTTREITEKKTAEQVQEELIRKLSETLAEKEQLLNEVKTLRKLLPICSGCKRIRDEHDKWWPIDVYIAKQTDSDLTHTICPDCSEIFYSDLESKK